MFHHFTTIIPKGVEGQLEKLKTWHSAHGQPIYTLNHSRETLLLRPHLPDWVIPLERRFAREHDRDYLPFEQIFAAFCETVLKPDDRLLLINSDISLEDERVLEDLDDTSIDLIFGSRLDVTELGCCHERFTLGYDVFSLKRSAASILDIPEFYMGLPWWDYILPMTAVTQGYRVKRLDTYAFHHVLHPQRWSTTFFYQIGWNSMQRLLPENIRAGSPSHERVNKFAQITNALLNDPMLSTGALSNSVPPEKIYNEFIKRIQSDQSIGPARDRSQIEQVFRKPSILLGPLAPRWRDYKAKRRAKRDFRS